MTTTPMTATEAITAALAAHPEASAAELAEAAGIGGSTASKCLASLERNGVAVRRLGGHEGGRRVADRWALTASTVSTGSDSSYQSAPCSLSTILRSGSILILAFTSVAVSAKKLKEFSGMIVKRHWNAVCQSESPGKSAPFR